MGENWAVFCGVRHQGVLRPGSLRTTVLHHPVFSTAKECWFFILVVYLRRKKKRPLASATCSHKLTDALMASQSHLPRNQFPCCWISLNSLWLGFFSDGMGGRVWNITTLPLVWGWNLIFISPWVIILEGKHKQKISRSGSNPCWLIMYNFQLEKPISSFTTLSISHKYLPILETVTNC